MCPRTYLMRWEEYAAEQRMWDARFGLLAEIQWNGTFTEPKHAADFFPSLAQLAAEQVEPEPQTEEEAREAGLKRGEMILAKMRAAWGG